MYKISLTGILLALAVIAGAGVLIGRGLQHGSQALLELPQAKAEAEYLQLGAAENLAIDLDTRRLQLESARHQAELNALEASQATNNRILLAQQETINAAQLAGQATAQQLQIRRYGLAAAAVIVLLSMAYAGIRFYAAARRQAAAAGVLVIKLDYGLIGIKEEGQPLQILDQITGHLAGAKQLPQLGAERAKALAALEAAKIGAQRDQAIAKAGHAPTSASWPAPVRTAEITPGVTPDPERIPPGRVQVLGDQP